MRRMALLGVERLAINACAVGAAIDIVTEKDQCGVIGGTLGDIGIDEVEHRLAEVGGAGQITDHVAGPRSEERRGGKEGRSRWSPDH